MRTKRMSYAALMCAVIIVSTLWFKFTIPGTDVMVTTQVFFVLITGHLLPPAYAFGTLGVYLMLGLAGLPVFSAACGPAVLSTPSFGFLLAFPFQAAAVSLIRKQMGRRKGARCAAGLVGVLAGYTVALPYIALLKGVFLNAPIPLATLFSAYCLAFLPMDVAKALLCAPLARRLEKTIG